MLPAAWLGSTRAAAHVVSNLAQPRIAETDPLVGTELGLVSGLRQIDMFRELTVTGLLTPDPCWSEIASADFALLELQKISRNTWRREKSTSFSSPTRSCPTIGEHGIYPAMNSGLRFVFSRRQRISSAGTCEFLLRLRRRLHLAMAPIGYLSPIPCDGSFPGALCPDHRGGRVHRVGAQPTDRSSAGETRSSARSG